MSVYFSGPNQETSFPGLSNSKFQEKALRAVLGIKFCLELKLIPLLFDILIKFGDDVLRYIGKERQTREKCSPLSDNPVLIPFSFLWPVLLN